MSFSKWQFITPVGILLALSPGCASLRSAFGINDPENHKPITNPFEGYRWSNRPDPTQSMILRSKKGDRSVELEIPEDRNRQNDFYIPISPNFKDTARSPASDGGEEVQQDYQGHAPTLSDREITHGFSQGLQEDEKRRQEIEAGLHLAPSEDSIPESSQSYLASLDHVKQLYRSSRFEAALIEVDELLKLYQTDAKLYEMRGTLLDRLGERELALKSWNQALRFNPRNATLKKFVDRKQIRSTAGNP